MIRVIDFAGIADEGFGFGFLGALLVGHFGGRINEMMEGWNSWGEVQCRASFYKYMYPVE